MMQSFIKIYISLFFLFSAHLLFAQQKDPYYWQQKIAYKIKTELDVQTNILQGSEEITYWNNSPDTLGRVFFHLYWNAFQPGSMMDVRSRTLGETVLGISEKGDTIRDWDGRVRNRIHQLTTEEIGYDSVFSISFNGRPQKTIYHETILEVPLDQPILPKRKARFTLSFQAQVPVQIRRSGRDNAEGVRYSMSQWYPKMSEYDERGWHPVPYVAREFHGVWGTYEVELTLDSSYYVAGTGYLKEKRPEGEKNIWTFEAPDVHDFVWAADPDYVDRSVVADNKAQTTLHVVYKKTDEKEKEWEDLLKAAARVLPFLEKHFGPYPYKQYSFIQGGDGGMEYPMATLVKGPGLGTAFHEWMHSWYQMMMASNESDYPWMDEGFVTYGEKKASYYYTTTFADSIFSDEEKKKKALQRLERLPTGMADVYESYFHLIKMGLAEPMTTFSDHYETNYAYGQNAYTKGAVFLEQLSYIVGQGNMDRILLEYDKRWRFKHPTPDDFVRVAEDVSGMKLDWYQEYWINTLKTIDYGIDTLVDEGNDVLIRLKRTGFTPMPLDVVLTFKDGHQEICYIPNYLLFGKKPNEEPQFHRMVFKPWPFTNPTYTLRIPFRKKADLQKVEIDPSQRMADTDRVDNVWIFRE